MKLYHFPASTNSRKVRILLIEKGLEYERIDVDLTKKEQKNPEYLKIHPFGQVPALDDDGFIVYDSTIINEYLEDEYPHPPLLPNDSEGRARARLMEDFRDIYFTPHFVEIIHEVRKPETERDQKVIQNAKETITQCFDRIERELEGRDYLAGTFSLADISFMPNIALLERLEIPVDPKYKNMRAWIERLKARPSFAESAK
ncbi:MAG: glutathione S-transferase family protein [Deltaproteobacteria bacterium]|nr:glutathione S-transferase family protein [Deltaproteobacteria bacterium]MCH7912189.1 glutathione S-transferase family protein [Deltaproteobacteria bacterium]